MPPLETPLRAIHKELQHGLKLHQFQYLLSSKFTGSDTLNQVPTGNDLDSSNPITVFLFHAVSIVSLCEIVHLPILLHTKALFHCRGDWQHTSWSLRDGGAWRIPYCHRHKFQGCISPKFECRGQHWRHPIPVPRGVEVDVKFIKMNLTMTLTVGLMIDQHGYYP